MLVVCLQVNKCDMVNYTGVGDPPFCMIDIKAISNEITSPSLKFTVNLGGFATRIELAREAEDPSG